MTVTNTGSQSMKLTAITPSSPSFTTSGVDLPATIAAGGNVKLSVFYNPSQIGSESGALDLTFDAVPDDGTSLTGTGVASSSLSISTPPTLPQATKSAAYQARPVHQWREWALHLESFVGFSAQRPEPVLGWRNNRNAEFFGRDRKLYFHHSSYRLEQRNCLNSLHARGLFESWR